MLLLTKEIENRLPRLYETEEVDLDDKVLQVKFFTPLSNWTWYVVEYDPESKTFFGLVDGLEKEWGYFSLEELESVQERFGLKIERDLYFKPTKYKDLSKE